MKEPVSKEMIIHFLLIDFTRMRDKYGVSKKTYGAWCEKYLKNTKFPREREQVKKDLLAREDNFKQKMNYLEPNNPKE